MGPVEPVKTCEKLQYPERLFKSGPIMHELWQQCMTDLPPSGGNLGGDTRKIAPRAPPHKGRENPSVPLETYVSRTLSKGGERPRCDHGISSVKSVDARNSSTCGIRLPGQPIRLGGERVLDPGGRLSTTRGSSGPMEPGLGTLPLDSIMIPPMVMLDGPRSFTYLGR